MKIISTIAFAVALQGSAFAGQLSDAANVFGPRGKEVSDAIASLPVWIETMEQTPAAGIKPYADAKAAQATTRGFYVVITTRPREWRVSMHPVGLASSEGVRLAGDKMVAKFKRGQFAEGAVGLSRELVRLAEPRPRVSTIIPPVGEEISAGTIWLIVVLSSFALLSIVWALTLFFSQRRERLERLECERLERLNPPESRRSARDLAAATAYQKTEAERLFNSYSPTERERIIHRQTYHHIYSHGAFSDPLMFYLLMQAATQPHYGASGNSALSPSDTPRRVESTSSSDYSGSSSSGGGSSFDLGSSSSSADSSGGGGSW